MASGPTQDSDDSKAAARPADPLVRAHAAHKAGALEQAETLYRAALAERPELPDALHLLGLVRYQRGDSTEAVALIERAIALRGGHADYHFNLGKILLGQGRLEAATEACRRACELAPDNPGALLNLGNSWRRRGDPKRAEDCYRGALTLQSDYGMAHNNLATLCRSTGRLEEAIRHYRRAVELLPDSAAIWENLGRALTDVQIQAEALEAYRRALALDPSREVARHMAAALGGETTAHPPEHYVRDLFDDYAARFERHLVGELDYRVPELIGALAERLRPGGGFEAALDLGCGTGLVGAALRPRVARLEGLDLSGAMVEQARAKGVYDALEQAGAQAFLEQAEAGRWDLILAAEMLIYVGALDDLFPAVARALRPGGLFLFSSEIAEPGDEGDGGDGGYRLRPSGRYAHARGYLERLAAASGLVVRAWDDVILRKDGKHDLPGWLIALERS